MKKMKEVKIMIIREIEKKGEFTYESTIEPLVGAMEAIGHNVKVEKLEK